MDGVDCMGSVVYLIFFFFFRDAGGFINFFHLKSYLENFEVTVTQLISNLRKGAISN